MAAIILASLLIYLSGCSYYRAVPKENPSSPMLTGFQDSGKRILLHHGDSTWDFKNIDTSESYITGDISIAPAEVSNRLTKPDRANRYRPKKIQGDSSVTTEVHIYISEYELTNPTTIKIVLEAIQQILVYDHDTGATLASWMLGTIGVAAGAFGLFMIIVLLTKSSCPFIYSWNGEFFDFTGEIYSGAIQPGLERHDYLPLPTIVPEKGMYKVRMTNEVKEIQHTNLAELIVFDTPSNINVLVDKHGNYHTYSKASKPDEAINLKGKDILDFISEKDSLNYFGEAVKKDQSINDGIIMKYIVPEDALTAKLVVNAKNSLWLDYLFTQFHGMFGESYHKFQAKQKKVSAEDMNRWYLEQNIPLSVYIEKDGEWEYIDYFNLVGPMAFKEDIIQFDVSQYKNKELKIKLESGYMFWEIDYAGLDFSKDVKLNYEVVSVNDAIDNKGDDVKLKLLSDDSEYYIQPDVGDEVILNFKAPEAKGKSQTVILHSKGYYIILREQEGKANKKKLREFRNAGRLPEYSIELFNKFRASRTEASKVN